MPPAPTVTVILSTRDRPRLLADAVACVAAQRLAPLELRIADDGEVPAQPAVPPGLLELTLIRVGAGQAGGARNRAARGARGEVLAFLDDDDRWSPGHLDGLAQAMADRRIEFAYRDCAVVREEVTPEGRRIERERRVIAREWDLEVMRRDDYLPPSGWGVRRALFERLGGFDESFRYSEDWDFVLRAAALTTPRRIPGTTVEVRLRASGNASAERGTERGACLERLAARHGLRPLEIKSFWEVARVVAPPPGRR